MNTDFYPLRPTNAEKIELDHVPHQLRTGRTPKLVAARRNQLPIALQKLVLAFLALTIYLLLTGCSGVRNPLDPAISGPFHKPGNYYVAGSQLREGIRRVAMLPVTSPQTTFSARSGVQVVQPVLYGELSKARLFEVLLISNEKLEEWTGKPSWDRDEILPSDLLVKIREQTGCDAILFSQLSYYRPYPPLAIGWRLLLVKAEGGEAIWSLDEVFDAGEPRVMNSAKRYALENERINAEVSKHVGTGYGAAFPSRVSGWEGLTSPTHFAKYAANAAVQTLTVK